MFYDVLSPGTVVEFQGSGADQGTVDLGVTVHAAMTWLVAYVPGDATQPAHPADCTSIRILRHGEIVAHRDLVDCPPAWVVWTWDHLEKSGSGLLQAPETVRAWKLAATIAQLRLDAQVERLITLEQLEAWAGRPLTDGDIERLDEAIPLSSIPDAIAEIVDGLDTEDNDAP